MTGIMLWSYALLWILILVVAGMLAGLIYVVADLIRRVGPDRGPVVPNDGLKIGSRAPMLGGAEVRTGRAVQLSDYDGRSVAVVFLSPTCKPCVELVPHLNEMAKYQRNVPILVVVLQGHGFDYAHALTDRILLLGDAEGKLQAAWEVERTPLTYVINADGTVRMKSVSNDLLDLEDTLDGIGWQQGTRPWEPVEDGAASPARM
jgi:hypothetical protein